MLFRKNKPVFTIAHESTVRSQRFYVETPALEPPCQSKSDENPGLNQSRDTTATRTSHSQPESHSAQKETNSRQRSSKLLASAKSLVRLWLSLAHPFHSQGALFRKAGITSGSVQAKIKKDLLRFSLIIEHQLQIGKTKLSIWEPTDKAYDIVGMKKPRHKSKGGYPHQFIAYHMRIWAKEQDYSADIEFMLSNGKAVDLVLRKGSELIFVEIAVSPPLQKELTNIIKDFSSDMIPDSLVVAVVNGRTRNQLVKLIACDDRMASYRDRIQVVLAGDFITKD